MNKKFKAVETTPDFSLKGLESGRLAVKNSIIDTDTFEDTFGIPYNNEE